MSSDHPSAIEGKRKRGRKSLEDTETPSPPMEGLKCQEQHSPQASGDGGLATAKRARRNETTTASPTPELADGQGRDGVEGEVTPASPEITYVVDVDPPEEVIQPPGEGFENDEQRFGSRFWEAEYRKLKEIHDQYRDKTQKELTLLKDKRVNSEVEVLALHWHKYHDRKKDYARDPGYEPKTDELEWDYGRVSREISTFFDLLRLDIPSILLRASDDPEYWLIAGECRQPWLKQILSENHHEVGGPPFSFWVAERVIMRYILRCVFEPMLVGLDKEADSLLLRVRANMESRMVPTMAAKWMGETLRSYTLLPKYDEDRNDYLRNHAKNLRNFVERFFPIPESLRDTGIESSAKRSREKIFELIMEPAADLATKMSFSYQKYEVGWEYCDKTTEIFYNDLLINYLGKHEVLDFLGAKIGPEHFPGFGRKDKIGDVVLFVRPPIFVFGMTGDREIAGPPIVVVKPVSGYDPTRRSIY